MAGTIPAMRFAKIAGEMLVLVTERREATRAVLLVAAQREGLAGLFVPRLIVPISALPLLGAGKIDDTRVSALAATHDDSDDAMPGGQQPTA